MKVLVVYDSVYGNTEKIARAIGDAVACDVKVLRASEFVPSALQSVDFLFIGAPTNGGRPTQPMQDLLNKIPDSAVKGIKIAVFDTRIPAKWVKIFGYAAGKIANSLKTKGGTAILSLEGFFVKGSKGPLIEGELERAAIWAKELVKNNK
jgi:flavodoxin I